MDPLKEMVFIGEIVKQINIAQRAANRLNAETDAIGQWESIQSIITATSNISMVLWPVNKAFKERGVYLRKILEFNEKRILKARTMRNHFAHYDERIEQWLDNRKPAVYLDQYITIQNASEFNFTPFAHRGYNPETGKLQFREEKFDLISILSELQELKVKCKPYCLVQ